MEIVEVNLDSFSYDYDVAIALGNFDGIHLAHQKIIKEMITTAKENNLKSSVLLFKNHTKSLLNVSTPKLLSSEEEKIEILDSLGVDVIFVIPFDQSIMKLSPEEFIEELLIKRLSVKSITVGFDYRFGYKASGNKDDLLAFKDEYGLIINIIDAISLDNKELISSTKIREYLSLGEVKKAANMLGRNYKIKGKVIPGSQRGRVLGFPTANIEVEDGYLIPRDGIYATYVYVDGKKYLSGTNVGKNLTFNGEKLKIESFIIDFSEYIYDKDIEIEFIDYIREERKFPTADMLIEQIEKDIERIKTISNNCLQY